MQLPLAGIQVVDLTSVIMGPFATHILADMGAEVVKVESPEGDSIRHYQPLRHPGMSGIHLNLNRNKRSVCLDLKRPEAREAVLQLAARADVFVHSLRPDSIARLGLDYEAVRKTNPGIVYCGAYGFGAAGPYSSKAAYDDIIQAGSGIAALTMQQTGRPAYAPTVICDKLSGQAIAYAVCAALVRRFREGTGASIEVPMFETSAEFNLIEHFGGGAFEPPLGRMGFARVLSKGRKPYQSADGYICILPYSDQNWRDYLGYVGLPAVADDPRFADLPTRVQHIDELYAIVDQKTPERTTREWVEFCDRVNIPCMPVLGLDELPDDPHLKAVGLFRSVEHPSEGPYRYARSPLTFDGEALDLRRHAPRLGEHTEEVLSELGYDKDAVKALMR